MDSLSAILALLTGIAGWFYLFYATGAHNLGGLEDERLNRRRAVLRRVGGGVMLLLGVGLYLGFHAVDADHEPRAFVAIWVGVMGLMAALIVLAAVDVGLTFRLRKRLRTADADRNRGPGLDRDPNA